MIPEYKLYHGAVLAELVHRLSMPVSIDELAEAGRLSSYVLNGSVGLHIKHSAQRLHPWPFTFTKQNLAELLALSQLHRAVFVVLVCHTDGMVCLPVSDAIGLMEVGESEQAWLRADRRRGQWYSITGGRGDSIKRPRGLDAIVGSLEGGRGDLGQIRPAVLQSAGE